jgi:hypothetical protein
LARFVNYGEVVPLVESQYVEHSEIRGSSGTNYQVEIQFFWDDKARGMIRVFGSIDSGGIRAFFPLTQTLSIPAPQAGTT